MPDPNTEHGLRVQLATALRERDEALSREAGLARANAALADSVTRCSGIESERDALRAEVQRLREALRYALATHLHPFGDHTADACGMCAKFRAALGAERE